MAKKRVPGFGEGFQATFAPTANEVMMMTLKQLLAQPAQEQEARLREAQIAKLNRPDTTLENALSLIQARSDAALSNAQQLAEQRSVDQSLLAEQRAKTQEQLAAQRAQSQEQLAGVKEEYREKFQTIGPEDAKSYREAYPYLPDTFFVGKRKDVLPQVLSNARKAQDQIAGTIKVIKSTEALKKQWDEIAPYLGAVTGRFKNLQAAVSGGAVGGDIAIKIKSYNDLASAYATQIRKAFGDSGAPSNFDVDRMTAILPAISQNKKLGEQKWSDINRIIATGMDSVKRSYPFASQILQAEIGGGGPSGATLPPMVAPQKTSATPAQSTEAIIKSGQTNGLSREQIKSNLKAAGY